MRRRLWLARARFTVPGVSMLALPVAAVALAAFAVSGAAPVDTAVIPASSRQAPQQTTQQVLPKEVVIQPFPPPAELGGTAWHYFPETGHYASGAFKRYFDGAGGVATLGYPVTEELQEDGMTVQYFQRARLELHPESAQSPVQRALLADLLLALRPELRTRGQFARPASPPPGGRYFPETGFAVDPAALAFFDAGGGVASFGYPISQAQGGVQWLQRARLDWSRGQVEAALIGDEYVEAAGLAHARQRAQPPLQARVDTGRAPDMIEVLDAPGQGRLVARLSQDSVVRVSGEASHDGASWYAVRLWNATNGYLPATQARFTAAPLKPPGEPAVPWRPAKPPAQGPLALQSEATARQTIEFARSPDGAAAGRLIEGARVPVTGWGTDPEGRAWLRFRASDGDAWVLAQALRLDSSSARRHPVVSSAVAGKGMWFTYDMLRNTSPELLVAAAKANGLTFLAPEVGTSRRGYWAGPEMDALLQVAHASGIKVIPWVYTWLADLPADLELTLQAARHSSPSGDRVDGIAVDIEENLDQAAIGAFGQVLRASLGPDALLIAITYQPQAANGRRTPFATLLESFDVIAPMSYWHLRNTRHSYDDAYSYVAESIRLIRARTGRNDVPIAVLGQTFDWFTRNEVGGGNPSADEVRGAMQASRDGGALGVGFFNWWSATPEEWETIGQFGW